MRDQIDVAYAALVEPAAHGSYGSIDEALNGLDESISMVLVDVDSFGVSAAAERDHQEAEAIFGGDARDRPRRQRKAVGTGNPLGDALARTLSEQ